MTIDIRMAQVGGLFSEDAEPRAPLSPREKRKRRDALFVESFAEAMRRRFRAVVRALRPDRIASLPGNLDFVLRERAIQPAGLPNPAQAMTRPDGLCGLVADASAELAMEGFARGLFPKADCGPLKWWSPSVRRVARPASFKLTAPARRLLRGDGLRFALDADFDATIADYARGRHGWRSGGLLSPRSLDLLAALADLGYAHAIDVDDLAGRRVGGAFGVAVGKVFVTLGAFGKDIDNADVALVILNRHLRQKGFTLHDFAGDADVERLGFKPMPRADYLALLAGCASLDRAGRWRIDRALCGRAMPGGDDNQGLPPRAPDGRPAGEEDGDDSAIAA